jgi:DNA repair protein RAD57
MSSPAVNRTQSSPLAHRGNMGPPATQNHASSSHADQPSSSAAEQRPSNIPTSSYDDPGFAVAEVMTLDHQQRFFTGWGDNPSAPNSQMKTPSLGLVWTTQIACRIALIKKPIYGMGAGKLGDEDGSRGEPILKKWRRYMKVVFAPWAEGGGKGVEFEIVGGGVRAVQKAVKD